MAASSGTRRGWQIGAVAGAAAGIAITSAIRLGGQRLRGRVDVERDDPLDPPTDLRHHYLDTHDGGSLHCIDTGAGPDRSLQPVILMHGVTLQWWVWAAVIRILRPKYRVIAWDMRGHGESRAGRDGVTLEATSTDLEMLIDRLDLSDVVLVGHSMGGMTIGRLVADRHEFAHDRVAALVFVATSAAPLSQAAVVGGLATLAGVAGRLAGNAVRRPRLSYPWHAGNLSAVLLSTAFGRAPTARMVEDVRRMEEEMSNVSMSEAAASIATHDVRKDLHAVDLPTVVLVGTHDKLTPMAHARALAALIDGAELEVIDGIGHQIMQEQPSAVAAGIDHVVSRGRSR